MARVRRALFVLSLLVSLSVFGQADQQIVSVTDSPDPVIPGNNVTYTVTVQNNGPNPAVNGGLNIAWDSNLTFQSSALPAGWACTAPAQFMSCTTPSFAPGSHVITLVAQVSSHLLAFADGTVSMSVSTSGVTPDPNNGNNNGGATTTYDSPQVDLQLTVSDSPDPVFPDGVVEYTVDVTNAGPDTASTVNFNAVPTSSYAFHSVTVPSGWNCVTPAVGALNATFTCSRAAWAPGTSQFVARWTANDENIGINDTQLLAHFSVGASTSQETNHANNSETETTQYTTPDADVSVAVSDSPDPVAPDGHITYTVTVANGGPDTAPNINLNAFGSNNLHFISATVPPGWNCTLPAPNAQTPGWNCNLPAGLANGANSVLVFVLQASDELNGINDGTILFGFSANSSVSDPNNANNSETESTAYTTPDADMVVSVSDSPDPVFPDGNITYTITVSNNGPDAAPNAALNFFNNGTLQYQSVTAPAGWSCSPPAVGATPTFGCTNPSFASGGNVQFTLVVHAEQDVIGLFDGTVSTHFNVGSTVSDPNNANNSETENTAYVTPDADMTVSVSDSPDPVFPDGNITYTVNVGNGGPDAAPNARLNLFNNGSLQFQSVTPPAGWNCVAPAINAAPTFTCTNPSFASGSNVVFTVVAQADAAINGLNDGTIQTTFGVVSDVADPNNPNSSETEDTAYVTPDADIAVTNADSPDPVSPGANITYTQSITNNGPDAANATFNQILESSVGFQSLSAPAGWSCTTPAVDASGAINCSFAAFPSGATANFTLVVEVIASSGIVTNTVVGGSNIQDPDNTDNSATVTTTILTPQIADLGIAKATSSDGAAPGSSMAYTILLTNNGPDDAVNVVVTDTLPSELLFQSIHAPAGWNCTTPAVGATGTITCTTASMDNSTTAFFTLVVQLTANAVGPINNNATATSDTTDNNAGNSTGSAASVPVGPGNTTDLSIQKSSQTTTAAPGDAVTYSIVVTNNGPGTANDVIVSDTLPASLLFQSMTPAATFNCTTPAIGQTGTITCLGGPLANGATATFTLVTTISPSASGSFINSAAVSTSDSDTTSSNSTDPAAPIIVASADLSITKTTPATQTTTGSTITYTITVTNNGPDAATNVVVSDNLPTGLQYVSAIPSQGSCAGTDPFTCSLGTINNGAFATITLQALVTATSGTVTNTATVTADTDDGTPGNNSGTSPSTPVTPASAGGANIPTMSEWALLALAAMLGLAAMTRMRM
jgi:uncharacterized repeat protein (TIGR01451 family)